MNIHTHPSDITAAPRDEEGRCRCHDVLACPDTATIAVNARDLADIADLLATLDAFLRAGEVTRVLADHLGGSRYDANLLIDRVGLTATHIRRLHQQHEQREVGERR